MLKSGLVSITFRNKSVSEICKLAQKAKLSGIEWGGDIHVPPKGNKAIETVRITRDCGIEIPSYGSYFHLGSGMDEFMYSLEQACLLTAPVMRIWAGRKGSAQTLEEERKRLTEELMTVSQKAMQSGVRIALEYHPNTLTDDRESVKRLMTDTQGEMWSPLFYWQPRWDWDGEETLAALSDLHARLSHAHVFSWTHTENGIIRNPISEGEAILKRALSIKKDGWALIEFVLNDSDEMLLRDAETLNRWINGRKQDDV